VNFFQSINYRELFSNDYSEIELIKNVLIRFYPFLKRKSELDILSAFQIILFFGCWLIEISSNPKKLIEKIERKTKWPEIAKIYREIFEFPKTLRQKIISTNFQ
jgi:methylase of polypeptide subunit release factors